MAIIDEILGCSFKTRFICLFFGTLKKLKLVLCYVFPQRQFFYWPCISTTELKNFECETENFFFWNLQHMIFVFRQIWNIIEMFVSERILFPNAFSHDLTSDSGHRCIGNCSINISEAWKNFSYRSSKKFFSFEIVSWKWVNHPMNFPLTHWGLVTPYGDRDLGQHWLR